MWGVATLLASPKNIAIVALVAVVALIGAYSVWLKYQLQSSDLEIVLLAATNETLGKDIAATKVNLSACNTNLSSIRNYSTKVDAIGKVTVEIKDRISKLQPTTTTIITNNVPIEPQGPGTLPNPPPATGGQTENEHHEAVVIANTIIANFNRLSDGRE